MELREADLIVERLRRTGPGGQHRNKRETGIRLTHVPTGIVVMATEERSQSMNLARAKERMIQRLEKLYQKRKKRIKTRVTKGSKARRLEHKKSHGEKKSLRRPVVTFD